MLPSGMLPSGMPTSRNTNAAKWAQKPLSMFTRILGKEDDAVIDEGLVAIRDVYNGRPTPSFRYAEALAIGIRQQLAIFET